MVDKLIEILESLGYPVYLQGSLLPDEPYPNSFFTFWNNDTTGEGFYDNDETSILWEFAVNFYSNDPLLVDSQLIEIKPLLKQAGFIVSGAGYTVPSDEDTHTGRAITVLYKEKL